MQGRPPDPDQNDPPLSPNTLTDRIHIIQPTDATEIDHTVKCTVPKIVSTSPTPAADCSGQNRGNRIRQIDSTSHNNHVQQFSDHSNNIPKTSDDIDFSQNLPPPEKSISKPNRTIRNRVIDSTSPKTLIPTISANLIHPVMSIDLSKHSGELHTGKNGVTPVQPPPKHPQNQTTTIDTHFPRLTSNYDRPNRAQRSNPHLISNSHLPLACLNATTTAHAIPTTQNNQTIIPTIQQLKAKFNHGPPVQQTSQSNNTSAPSPPNVVPSYAARLRASQTFEQPHIDIMEPVITTKQGLPAVLFNRDDFMIKLASNCKYTLIGKFASTMPKMEVIRKSLTSQLQIKGNCKVTHFNSTHVYIDLDNEIDHSIVWNKEKIFIEGRLMRLLVWTPTFTPEEETPITPVWLVLPKLPWHCYSMPFVTKLLEPVGRVLYFDAASIQRTRGSVAKVKIEIDITKPRPPHIWIGFPQEEGDVHGEGRWQELQFEDVPAYCKFCKHQGHSQDVCKFKLREDEYQNKNEKQIPGSHQTSVSQNNKSHANASKHQPQNPINEMGQSSKRNTHQQLDQYQASIWQVKNKYNSNAVPEDHVTDVITQKQDGGVNLKSLKLSEVPKNTKANLNCMRVSTNNSFGLLSTDQEQQVPVNAVSTIATGDDVHQPWKDSRKVGTALVDHPGICTREPVCAMSDAAGVSPLLHCVAGNEVPTSVMKLADHGTIDKSTSEPIQLMLVDHDTIDNSVALHGAAVTELGREVQNAMTDSGVTKKHDQMLVHSAHFVTGTVSAEQQDTENVQACLDLLDATGTSGTAATDKESTKSWVERSFGKLNVPDSAAEDEQPIVEVAENAKNSAVTAPVAETETINQHVGTEPIQPLPNPISSSVGTVLPSPHNTTLAGKQSNNTSTSGKKTRKKHGQKPDASDVKCKTREVTQDELQQSEEEALKVRIRAWQDAILAKSYAENPSIESNKKHLDVMENKAAESIPSQDSFDPANAITMGTENEDIEIDRALTAYVSPAHSGNTLIPTAKLEVMCKQASKVMKEVGRGFFPVTPTSGFDNEGHDAPTYFLGDLFGDSQNNQIMPSKIGKSKWNLNAPLFIPNALRQQETQLSIESDDSQDGPEQKFPTGPSDEVLLQRLDLHDMRGLLHRQNYTPQDLPQKFSSPHPGIIEDGSEYEDEDEDSTAYNKMAEARYAGLSPRLEQAVKPKLIKKKRRPLEIPKKREAVPKKPKRVQPTRSSKSRSSRRK